MGSQARPMTAEEYKNGHVPCQCGEYTHVFRQCAMQRLPRDYSGELCHRCSLWMCRIDKMAPLVAGDAQPTHDRRTASAGYQRLV